MIEVVRRPHATGFPVWAADRPEVVVLSADLTSSCEADTFRDTHRDRFFSMGMAEQNMMGVAGGLAREGFVPFVHTFGVFVTRRPYEQVAISIAYPNLKVRLLGFLPGVTTPGGITHQATDDVALMRALPNMTVLSCADATDLESMLDPIAAVNGPVYVRMLRGEVPRLFPADQPLVIGQARRLSRGDQITIVTEGVCTEEALRALPVLEANGISVQLLSVSTLKPFDDPRVIDAVCGATEGVVTLENHSVIGGLGSAVAEVMAERGARAPLRRLGLQDRWAHGASRPYLLAEYGLDAAALIDAVGALLGERLSIDEASMGEAHAAAMHSLAKPEAL